MLNRNKSWSHNQIRQFTRHTTVDILCCFPCVVGNVLYIVPWASYQIRKIAGCACAGNAGNVFPRHRFQRKPLVSDSGMHHGTCVTHVPWCMSGSLTCGDGENVPGIPGACAPAILRICQEAHGNVYNILPTIAIDNITYSLDYSCYGNILELIRYLFA